MKTKVVGNCPGYSLKSSLSTSNLTVTVISMSSSFFPIEAPNFDEKNKKHAKLHVQTKPWPFKKLDPGRSSQGLSVPDKGSWKVGRVETMVRTKVGVCCRDFPGYSMVTSWPWPLLADFGSAMLNPSTTCTIFDQLLYLDMTFQSQVFRKVLSTRNVFHSFNSRCQDQGLLFDKIDLTLKVNVRTEVTIV